MTKLSHDIAERKKERIFLDPNVLSVDHAEVPGRVAHAGFRHR